MPKSAEYWVEQMSTKNFHALSTGIGLGELRPPKVPAFQPVIEKALEAPKSRPIMKEPLENSVAAVPTPPPPSPQARAVKNEDSGFLDVQPTTPYSVGPLAQPIPKKPSLIKPQWKLDWNLQRIANYSASWLIDLFVVGAILVFLVFATGYLTGTYKDGFQLSLFGKDPLFRWAGKLRWYESASAVTALFLFYWMIFKVVVGQTIGQIIIFGDHSSET